MKRALAAMVLLLAGTIVPAYGQAERHELRGAPPPQRTAPPSQRAAPPPQRAAPPAQRAAPAPEGFRQPGALHGQAPPPASRPAMRGYAPPARPPAEARAWHAQGGWRQPGAWPRHDSWSEHRSANWQADRRGWSQRGGYGGYYIAPDRFARHFGSPHLFRLRARPLIVDGYPRFRHGGYWFVIVDPWPAYWGDDWYESDDLYVDYEGDGYYLHNRRYPDVAIAVTVSP